MQKIEIDMKDSAIHSKRPKMDSRRGKSVSPKLIGRYKRVLRIARPYPLKSVDRYYSLAIVIVSRLVYSYVMPKSCDWSRYKRSCGYGSTSPFSN